MIAIVTIDDNNGMMFNKRRQSKDIRLIERILDIAGTNRIWVSEYSSQLFDTSKIILSWIIHIQRHRRKITVLWKMLI